eukprot:jgi/Phyca11/96437/e_gw1.1.831.1
MAAAAYSASIVERATEVCFLEAHAITIPFSISTAPETDFALVASPAQSASE